MEVSQVPDFIRRSVEKAGSHVTQGLPRETWNGFTSDEFEVGASDGSVRRVHLMPEGVHPASVDEVKERLVWNAEREQLWRGLVAAAPELRSRYGVEYVALGGSFGTTDYATPGDMDVVAFRNPKAPEVRSSRSPNVLERFNSAQGDHGVHAYPNDLHVLDSGVGGRTFFTLLSHAPPIGRVRGGGGTGPLGPEVGMPLLSVKELEESASRLGSPQFSARPEAPEPQAQTVEQVLEYIRDPSKGWDAQAVSRMMAGVQEAVSRYYQVWLHGSTEVDASAYRQLLQDMHRSVVEHGYKGFSDRDGVNQGDLAAGRIMTGQDRPFFTQKFSADLVPDFHPSFDPLRGHRASVPVEGVSENGQPSNMLSKSDHTVEHTYPDSRSIFEYVRKSAELDAQMRAAFQAGDKEQTLRLLSRYYHVAINGHFFRRVNNTLLMAQVNEVLHGLGLSGISHGMLDYQALTKPETVDGKGVSFRQDFVNAVAARNPSAKWVRQALR